MTFYDVLTAELENKLYSVPRSQQEQAFIATDVLKRIVTEAIAMGYLEPVRFLDLRFEYNSSIIFLTNYASKIVYNLKEIEYPTKRQISEKMIEMDNSNIMNTNILRKMKLIAKED